MAQMSEAEERDHVDMLCEKLLHRDPARRQRAAIALAAYVGDQVFLPEPLEPHPAAILAKEMRRPRATKQLLTEGSRAFAIMGPPCAAHASACLGELVGATDFEVRFEAMRAVRNLGPAASEAAPSLARALLDREDTSELLRFQAARALEALGPAAVPAAGGALAAALDDEDLDVRLASCSALVAMGAAAAELATPALVEVLRRRDGFELKRLAVDALAAMGPAAAAASDELGKILRPQWGDDAVLRQKAAVALGAMGEEEVRRPLRQLQLAKALGDPDGRVGAAARATLQAAACTRALNGSMALFERLPEEYARADASAQTPADDRPPTAPRSPTQPVEEAPGEEGVAAPANGGDDPVGDAAPAAERRSSTFADFLAQAESKATAEEDRVRLESQRVMQNLGIEEDAGT